MVDFRALLKRLTDHDVDYVVIGGVAAALHGSPVTTLDIDVCTTFRRPNVDRIVAALRDINPRLRMRPDKMPLPMNLDYLAEVKNLYLETDLGRLDLLGELPGIAPFDALADRAIPMNVGGFTCRVLDLDTLIAAKTFAGREKDKYGLFHLEAIRKMREQQPGLFDGPRDKRGP